MRDKGGNPKRGEGRKRNPESKGKFNPKKSRLSEKENVKKRPFSADKTRKRKETRAPQKQQVPGDDKIRLNRFIANAGICSRREADTYITAGVVSVNGKIVTELGTKVSITDQVKFHDKPIKSEKPVYVLLNKPKDYVTTVEDPHATKTVMDLVKDACHERIYPVGRLDKNTTGVLLLTNDGDLASKLTHPKFVRSKLYHVYLDKNLKSTDFDAILKGIELEDGLIYADSLSYVDKEDHKQVGIEIHSGRNRIVRRIFESLGYKIRRLDRVYFAGLTKKGLPRGKWRLLTDKEISMLKGGAFK